MSSHQSPLHYGKEDNVKPSVSSVLWRGRQCQATSLLSIMARKKMSSLQTPQYYDKEDNVKPPVSSALWQGR